MAAKTQLPNTLADGLSLVEQMRPALFKYFRRKTGSATDAEDLTQDVLVSALTHLGWTSEEQAKGYIFRAAINRLRDRRRRMQVQGVALPYDDEATGEPGSQNPLERVLVAQEELAAIDSALDELNIRTRTVLLLVKLEHMKATTVAEMLGISVRAVNKHVQKGIAHLAKALAREDQRS
jgi:RNA polymerase sigma factor (sigma-70 family)